MHLKSCCALLLLALVACQAAPSTFKNIEKKSITEETSKLEKDDLNIEDPGTSKDRAKKSATTFCVEVRDGTRQEVPCPEAKPPVLLLQSELPKPVLYQTPALGDYPVAEIRQPLQVVQQQQIQQGARPRPPSPFPFPFPFPLPKPFPQRQTQYDSPAVQTSAPAQAPIVNIVTPPATCNVLPGSTLMQTENTHELLKEAEHLKPISKPIPVHREPKPVSQLMPMKPAPYKQDVIVLPSKPLALYPEKQLAVQVTELEPQVTGGAECVCNQRGRPSSLFRHHPKMHEHHVMIHPSINTAPVSPLVIQPPCPMSYLSNNHPTLYGEYPANTYGDTLISVHQERPRPYYPNVYPSFQLSRSLDFLPEDYSEDTYDSQPSQSVTVNAFPRTNVMGSFRQAQSSPQSLMENNELKKGNSIPHQTINPISGTSKRETDPIQIEQNQQVNILQEQAVEPGKTLTEMKFSGDNSAM